MNHLKPIAKTILLCAIMFITISCSLLNPPGSVKTPTSIPPAPTIGDPILLETPGPTSELSPGGTETVQVYYEAITASVAISKPKLIVVKIRGNLPDPCTRIMNRTYYWVSDHVVELVITAERQAGMMCAQVLTPFTESVEIDMTDKPAGSYTLIAGDIQTTFEYRGSDISAGKSACPPRIPGSNGYKQPAIDNQVGFCFLYPYEFSEAAAQQADGVTLIGPARQLGQRTINAKVDIAIYPLESGMDLRQFVLAHLKTEKLPLQTTQEQLVFAGQDAVRLQIKTNDVIAQSVFFKYHNHVYQVSLSPLVDGSPLLTNDINASYDLIERSWVFINED